jgi:hypothetical protein
MLAVRSRTWDLLRSMPKTRCNRAIERIGAVRTFDWGSSSVAGLLTTLGGAVMRIHSRALAANRPRYLTR